MIRKLLKKKTGIKIENLKFRGSKVRIKILEKLKIKFYIFRIPKTYLTNILCQTYPRTLCVY
jgi:hypothetical protein